MILFLKHKEVNLMQKSKSVAGIVFSLLGGIFWGLSGSCGQYLFTYHNVSSDWLVPIRMLSTGIILLCISAMRHRGNIFDVWRGKSNFIRMGAFTLFGLIMCQYSYFTAIELSDAGTATVLQYLSPAMILVFTCFKNKKLPMAAEVIAIILAIGGTFVIATGGKVSSLAVSPAALFWGIIAGVFLACYSLIPVPLLKIADTPTVLGWGMLIGGAALMPVFRPWESMPEITFSLIAALAGVIILGTVIAYTFYLEGIHLIGATKASIISSIEPVSATVISALWLGTDFSFADIIGFAMIISTIFIISFHRSRA